MVRLIVMLFMMLLELDTFIPLSHRQPFGMRMLAAQMTGCSEVFWEWFDDNVNPSDIPKSILGRLDYRYFGVNDTPT
jgi:hypothetical protein